MEQQTKVPGIGAIDALKFFAWFDFACGIIGGLLAWRLIGIQYVTENVSYYPYIKVTEQTNVAGIILAVGIALQGVLVCALFLVIASMAENLIAIRRNTTPASM
jgi:hypothetical protein